MKSSDILMFIDELSMRAITSFVPSIFWFTLLWGDSSPVCCSFHSFWPIWQFCLQNEAACWIFLNQSNENRCRWSCVIQHRRMSTDWSVLADQKTFHFWEVTTPISGHAYTEPVSEQSKHPNNAYVICVFKWAAQSDWEQWHKTRPDLHANGHAEHGWVSFWQAYIIALHHRACPNVHVLVPALARSVGTLRVESNTFVHFPQRRKICCMPLFSAYEWYETDSSCV